MFSNSTLSYQDIIVIPCLPRLGIHDSQGGILGCKGKTHDICYPISLLQKSQLASASTDMTWVRNKVWTGWCLAQHPCPHTKRSVIHWTVLASCAHDLSREHTRLLISKKVNDKPGAMCNMENHVVLCQASDMSPLYIYTHFNLILAIMRSYIYSIQVKSFRQQNGGKTSLVVGARKAGLSISETAKKPRSIFPPSLPVQIQWPW